VGILLDDFWAQPVKRKARLVVEKKNKKVKLDAFTEVATFADKVTTWTEPIYVGIDPGATGAIAFKCKKFYCVINIPVILTEVKKVRKNNAKQKKATGKQSRTVAAVQRTFDYAGICKLFSLFDKVSPGRMCVILEQIPPMLGPGHRYAEIMLNRAYMLWPLYLHAKGYVVREARPNIWKKALDLLGKDKEASRLLALTLYPNADISRKADHDKAEALLLVEYLRRLNIKGA